MPKENVFLTSVANVRLFDGTTGDLILNGKTMLNTSMTQAIQNQAIYAGKGSKKVYELDYQKEISFAIEDAGFSMVYIALQNGTEIAHQLSEYFTEELIKLDATGKGKINGEAIGKIQVEQNDGTFSQFTIDKTTKEFTVPAMADKEVQVVYALEEMMDVIEISGEKFPKAVRMELNTDLRSNSGKIGEVIIDVPHFKPNGAMELSMTHDGVSSSSLEGTALADSKGNYAYVKIHRIGAQDIAINALASNPSQVIFDSADPQPVTPVISGIRGGGYGLIPLKNEDLQWESHDPAIATVDATGKIEMAAGATDGQTTTIHVKKDGLNFVETIEVHII